MRQWDANQERAQRVVRACARHTQPASRRSDLARPPGLRDTNQIHVLCMAWPRGRMACPHGAFAWSSRCGSKTSGHMAHTKHTHIHTPHRRTVNRQLTYHAARRPDRGGTGSAMPEEEAAADEQMAWERRAARRGSRSRAACGVQREVESWGGSKRATRSPKTTATCTQDAHDSCLTTLLSGASTHK